MLWTGTHHLTLMQGSIHPVDALVTTRITDLLDRDEMVAFVHRNASLFFPVNHQTRTMQVFYIISAIPSYMSCYNFRFFFKFFFIFYSVSLIFSLGIARFYCEFLSTLLDPSVMDNTCFYTETDPSTGVPVAVPVMGAQNKYYIAAQDPSWVTEGNWKTLCAKIMDVMGVSLVDFFYCHDGYLPHYMNSEAAMEGVVSDMRMSGHRRYKTPWISFFFHPFFRKFLPKINEQAYAIRSKAVTNVTYGGEGQDVVQQDIQFQYYVREMRCPPRVINDTLHQTGLNESIFLGISIQEVHNQRIIRESFKFCLEMEAFQVLSYYFFCFHFAHLV